VSIKFDDIMQKFYNDPKLGLKNEEAPANASGSAVAGTGDDSSTVVVKKKKKNPYDGRTKEARQFYKRMTELKAKRESKLAKKVQESTLERAPLVEDNIDALRKIVKDKQASQIKFKDGKVKVDMFTASAVVKVYDALNKMNQDKVGKMLNDKKANFMKFVDFALSKVK
jgi:hypothetical protein